MTAMRGRAHTIARGAGEWVIFSERGARVTSFPYLAHPVACVKAIQDGAFDRRPGGGGR
jgi:hypothetical protein